MMINDLLREKYRVQKELGDKSGHDLTKCIANAHLKMKEVEAVYGVKFKCAKQLCITEVCCSCTWAELCFSVIPSKLE